MGGMLADAVLDVAQPAEVDGPRSQNKCLNLSTIKTPYSLTQHKINHSSLPFYPPSSFYHDLQYFILLFKLIEKGVKPIGPIERGLLLLTSRNG